MNTPQQKLLSGNRLNIPNATVKTSGFTPGETAYVLDEDPTGAVQKPCLVLMKEKPVNPLGSYGVSKGYRLRVAPAILKRCGLDGSTFEIDGKDGRIIVRIPQREVAIP